MGKKVLVIGGGGREHALAWKLAQSPMVESVYVAPGNAGTAREAKTANVAIKVDDIQRLLAWTRENKPDLTIVGHENSLAAGVVDAFNENHFRILGPSRAAAQLESSKVFTKEFLKRHAIPTAAYEVYTDIDAAIGYLRSHTMPVVLKADGLGRGKGVLVARTLEEAISFARECLSGTLLGESGRRIVIEEFMDGEEATCMCVVDGTNFIALPFSQDHKRVFDGDQGPNTGGMGAYSPVPIVTADVEKAIVEKIVQPTIAGMRQEGTPFTGFLYAGLMIKDGVPKVVEFNVRLGDPEAQVIMMRLKSDLVELIEKALDGKLAESKMEVDERAALCVVMASGGYPGEYATGEEITGIEEVEKLGAKVFHAGTKEADGKLVTSGGRVLGVTALGDSIVDAQKNAYDAVAKIHFDNAHFRKDIGRRAIRKETI
ncbi:phosphoribosylamine--glycine ligase [Candidatus Kaiserbacteria bacterium RIFCSPHIGHO2_01_FULL_56_24]|uniref:Phosphoribosylamine--glycine ligase n=1 Tax=Candidatus Kaiserbacteria bacterium RIFCSPHIGHO2_01_FULL_56_24 TaxID=1798487 RepID=A0A1F6DH92_9BACT|nr:MAG: phosphoribosylamine--glycine ligase [Candidatus Kaiserbacteria bacterium RIFCSPHIGHO2_01_FULL_56_24]